MNKFVIHIALMASAVLTSPAVSRASGIDFRDEAGMKQAIDQYMSDPAASYNIMRRAYDLRLEQKAADYYYTLCRSHPKDSFLKSDFAFSQYMAISYWMDRTVKIDDTERARLGKQLDIAHKWRLEALKQEPNSAPVLIEASIFFLTGLELDVPSRRECYDMICHAIKLAPDWADAYYWKATGIGGLPWDGKLLTIRSRMELECLAKAERLDAYFKDHDLLDYAQAYAILSDNDKALYYINKAIETGHHYLGDEDLSRWKASVEAQIAKRDKSTTK